MVGILLSSLIISTIGLQVAHAQLDGTLENGANFAEASPTVGGGNGVSGEYIYLFDTVSTKKINTLTDKIETTYHNGTNSWTHVDQDGINLTHCDTGTGYQECTNTNRYRRNFIFMIGYNSTFGEQSELHQLLPLENTNYANLDACMNTELNPLVYTLPEYYQYAAVMLYAYCGRASDSSWDENNFIDMRSVKTGSSTSIAEGTYLQPGTADISARLDPRHHFLQNHRRSLPGLQY